jgi:hypothetical protein
VGIRGETLREHQGEIVDRLTLGTASLGIIFLAGLLASLH